MDRERMRTKITMPPLEIQVVTGRDTLPYANRLAELRITVFREWPYLYDGSIEYERGYLDKYGKCPESVVVLALDGSRIVGASTGLPLLAADPEFQKPFKSSDYDLASIFYFGESILLPEYRGHGTGKQFFQVREAQARRAGAKHTSFCAVDRDAEDPRRPEDGLSLEAFWNRLGYTKQPSIQARFDWREIGKAVDSKNSLTYWIKAL